MTYATLMVHVELGRSNADLLNITADLAQRFQASVIGIAACQPIQYVYGDDFISGQVAEQNLAEIQQEAHAAETEFRTVLGGRVADLEWRCAITRASLADYIAEEARSADLLITAPDRGSSLLDNTGHVDLGDLIMRAGRPVLLVPTASTKLQPEHVLLAWKDSREARRAAFDALPLLEMASHVTVVEIAPEEELGEVTKRLDDVVGWLKRHGIPAEPLGLRSAGSDATALTTIARERGVGVIVAGAYGHSRLREWVLGGVTADLLLSEKSCSLLSH
jgi:nucleotide-binding universal stress UspA family protein